MPSLCVKNIVLNYLTHITEFIYPLLEKNYKNAIACELQKRVFNTDRIIQI